MFVPSVRENSTGVRVRKEELRRREESAAILRVPGTGVVSNEGLRVKARQGCGVAGWATRVGVCATANSNAIYEMEGQGGYRYLSGHRHDRCFGQMEE